MVFLDDKCKQQLSFIFLLSNFVVFRMGHAVTNWQIYSTNILAIITSYCLMKGSTARLVHILCCVTSLLLFITYGVKMRIITLS